MTSGEAKRQLSAELGIFPINSYTTYLWVKKCFMYKAISHLGIEQLICLCSLSRSLDIEAARYPNLNGIVNEVIFHDAACESLFRIYRLSLFFSFSFPLQG